MDRLRVVDTCYASEGRFPCENKGDNVEVNSIMHETTLLYGQNQMGQWCRLLTISRGADALHTHWVAYSVSLTHDIDYWFNWLYSILSEGLLGYSPILGQGLIPDPC